MNIAIPEYNLLRQLIAGDAEAFREVYNKYNKKAKSKESLRHNPRIKRL